jgi:hypothetical protein
VAQVSDRIEAAIEKLTTVSIELKSMLAVHEERLNKQEKTTGDIQVTVEKRREELDNKLKDVYDTMRDQDNNILREISNLREESQEAHKQLTSKINQLEKFIWMAVGGGMVLTWIMTNITNIFKVFH